MNILIEPAITLPPLSAKQKELICEAAGGHATIVETENQIEIIEFSPQVDVIFGTIFPSLLEKAPKLKWVHATASGIDFMLFPAFVESKIILTSEKGLVGPHLADHAMGLLLAITRRIGEAIRDERQSWRHRVQYRQKQLELEGLTMGIVGFGGTGKALAARASGFGMKVAAVDLVPIEDKYARVEGMDKLDKLIAQSDVVAIGLPLTRDTRHLFDTNLIAKMKRHAILINVTRGEIIEPHALIKALQSGHLGGAGLDVFTEEPLSEYDPLWDIPTVVMTPHTAGGSQHRSQRNINRFLENLGRFKRGEPLMGKVDKHAGF